MQSTYEIQYWSILIMRQANQDCDLSLMKGIIESDSLSHSFFKSEIVIRTVIVRLGDVKWDGAD